MQLRRQHIIVFLQALFILLAYPSCTSEDLADEFANTENPSSKGEACYLTIKIENVQDLSQSRASIYNNSEINKANSGDYIHGTEYEHAVGDNGNYVIFFDSNDKLFSIEQLEDGHEDNPGHNPTTDPEDYIEASYQTKFYPDEEADEENKWPSSCLVVLNGAAVYQELMNNPPKGSVSKEDILNKIWTENNDPTKIGRDGDLFTMTNSIYVKDGILRDTVKITEEHYTTDANKKKDLHVHVERMVAKCSFQIQRKSEVDNQEIFQPSTSTDIWIFNGIDSQGYPVYVAKKWRIEVTGWNLNAFEKQNYLFKKITNSNNGAWWNDAEHFRSYWSEDPHYAYQEDQQTPWTYPWQYRKPIDYKTINYYEDLENSQQNILKNYSFNDLNLGKPNEGESNFNEIFYIPENTYDADVVKEAPGLDSRDELLAGTHLLVGAELQIEEVANSGNYNPLDLYRDRSGICYLSERNCIAAFVHGFNQTLNSQSSMKFTDYDWVNRGKGEVWVAKPSGNYNLYFRESKTSNWQPLIGTEILLGNQLTGMESQIMPIATIENGDGKRLPWIGNWNNDEWVDWIDNDLLTILDSNHSPLAIYTKDSVSVKKDDKDGKITETVIPGVFKRNATHNDIKSLLYEWIGAIEHFSDGKMYYAHGINNPINDTAERYGVVRNNWYQFKLTDINSIGISVDDVTQPIVPGRNDLKDVVNVSIYILPWHHVEATAPFAPF